MNFCIILFEKKNFQINLFLINCIYILTETFKQKILSLNLVLVNIKLLTFFLTSDSFLHIEFKNADLNFRNPVVQHLCIYKTEHFYHILQVSMSPFYPSFD